MHGVRLWAVLLLLVGLHPSLSAQDEGDKKKEKPKEEQLYQVVQVDAAFVAMKSSETEAFKKSKETEFQEAMKKYAEAKAKAEKDKKEFKQAPPVKPKVKILGKKFKTEADAKAAAAKLKETGGKPVEKGGGKKKKKKDDGGGDGDGR